MVTKSEHKKNTHAPKKTDISESDAMLPSLSSTESSESCQTPANKHQLQMVVLWDFPVCGPSTQKRINAPFVEERKKVVPGGAPWWPVLGTAVPLAYQLRASGSRWS